MNHLKLFQEHVEPSFFKLDNNNAPKWLASHSMSKVDTKEASYIYHSLKIMFPGNDPWIGPVAQSLRPDYQVDISKISDFEFYIKDRYDSTILVIDKYTDEWFLVIDRKNSCFYCCDQISGLMDCLKKVLSLINYKKNNPWFVQDAGFE